MIHLEDGASAAALITKPLATTEATATTASKPAKNNLNTVKPPRAKHVSHKKPQAKLRDYFNDIDSNTNSAPTVSLLSHSLPTETNLTLASAKKNVKKELREIMLMNLSNNSNNNENSNDADGSFFVPALTEKQQLKMQKRMLKAIKMQDKVEKQRLNSQTNSSESQEAPDESGQLRLLKKSPKKNSDLEKTIKKQKPLSAAALKKLERMQKKANKLKFDKDLFNLPIKKQAKAALNISGQNVKDNYNSNYFFDTDEYNELDLEALNASESSSNLYGYHSQLVFEIIAEDGFKVISYDIDRAWRVIVDRVRKLRQDHKLKTLSFKSLNGARMYGLSARAVVFMLEQMESIEFCPLYTNKYIFRENTNEKWIINLNNCARTTRHNGGKKCLDQFYWLASDYRSLNCLNLGQRFNQQFAQAVKALTSTDMCNSLKFRHLKEFSKSALIVKRSLIHGRGLFTLVDLNPGQMIIEYAGEIIRNELCDRREKFYESKVKISVWI